MIVAQLRGAQFCLVYSDGDRVLTQQGMTPSNYESADIAMQALQDTVEALGYHCVDDYLTALSTEREKLLEKL